MADDLVEIEFRQIKEMPNGINDNVKIINPEDFIKDAKWKVNPWPVEKMMICMAVTATANVKYMELADEFLSSNHRQALMRFGVPGNKDTPMLPVSVQVEMFMTSIAKKWKFGEDYLYLIGEKDDVVHLYLFNQKICKIPVPK
jgi:hypothetical protein